LVEVASDSEHGSASAAPSSGLRPDIEALTRRGRATLLKAMSPSVQIYGRGDALMEMGEPHEFVYVVESGWLARSRTLVDGRKQIIVIFLPGEMCGIKSIFMSRQPDAIEALTDATTRRIHYQDACRLATQDFSIALCLAEQLALDERHLHNWNVRLGRANAQERMAALLLEFRTRLLKLGVAASDRFTLRITQEQIADHVGLTTVHVSRTLRQFREAEMAYVSRGEVVFLDNVAALEALAQPVQDLVGE
jgi:CRP/FNR family transcriptional regulator, anaerobic regulatory protein